MVVGLEEARGDAGGWESEWWGRMWTRKKTARAAFGGAFSSTRGREDKQAFSPVVCVVIVGVVSGCE